MIFEGQFQPKIFYDSTFQALFCQPAELEHAEVLLRAAQCNIMSQFDPLQDTFACRQLQTELLDVQRGKSQ